MKFALSDNDGILSISGYDTGLFTIGEQEFSGSILILPEQIKTNWPVNEIADLQTDMLDELIALKPEAIILGTGSQQVFPEPGLIDYLARHGIGLEVMNTPAACRTWNILAAEGRRILGALIPIR